MKTEHFSLLKQALVHLSMSRSEEELLSVLKNQLTSLCQVDRIHLTDTPWKGAKNTYTYCFTHKDQDYFVHFHKPSIFLKEERAYLKKVGQALEWTLLHLQTERHLEITKEQWELAFDAISIPISLTDKEHCILRTNQAFRSTLQRSKKELLKKNSFEVFFGKKIDPPDNKKIQKKTVIQGEEKTFEITQERLKTWTDQTMYLLVFRDMSQRIKMEKEIALSNKADEMDIISHSIAHELNNPLASLQALLQTMRPQAKNKPVLKEMEKAIQRCGQIVQKLLKTKP